MVNKGNNTERKPLLLVLGPRSLRKEEKANIIRGTWGTFQMWVLIGSKKPTNHKGGPPRQSLTEQTRWRLKPPQKTNFGGKLDFTSSIQEPQRKLGQLLQLPS